MQTQAHSSTSGESDRDLSMSVVKSKLKVARDALGKKDYIKAKEAALEVLDVEANSYHAHVFLGLALFELGEVKFSEEIYQKATKQDPDQQLAWQGLSRLYERTEQWREYVQTLYRMMDIQCSQNDAVRCAETLQKILGICEEKHDRSELIEAMSLLLPNSHVYAVLSMLPEPDDNTSPSTSTVIRIQTAIHESLPIIQEIASLVEAQEEDTFIKEIEKRRTRLGAPTLEHLRKLVGQDIWGSSRLPTIYSEIMNHPKSSDSLRREAESKLLRYQYHYLRSLPNHSTIKERILGEVNDLIKSAILLGIPDDLAWNLALEQQDTESIATCDIQLLQGCVKLFPNSQLAILLSNFFLYMGNDTMRVCEEDDRVPPDSEGTYLAILNAYSEISDTIVANRAMAEVYLKEEDYENAAKFSDHALSAVEKIEREMGVHLQTTTIGIKAIKATSLVHLHPPKYHSIASPIIDEVLSHHPTNVLSLLGRAAILQAEEKWIEAKTVYLRVIDILPEDENDRLRAVEEAAWCLFQCGQFVDALTSLQSTLVSLNDLPGRETDRARCLWRIGQCYWNINVEGRQESYRSYIASLKEDPTFAPAFTSLGIYYTEISPPDPNRALKCFQKAFELDFRQAEAAKRLIEGFAVDQEWDLVDVVACRTIEGLPLQTSDTAGLRPTHVWAWKAVGVVELIRGNFVESIKAFQTALVSDVNDGSLWSRLGEAYSKSGRYTAALKAFHKAEELSPDDWSCRFFIADAKRHSGDIQGAILIYADMLSNRLGQTVVHVSLIQSQLDMARLEQLEGLHERAEHSFVTTIHLTLATIRENPDSRMVCWKSLADALFYLSAQPRYWGHVVLSETLMEVVHELNLDDDDLIHGIPRPNLIPGAPINKKQVSLTALMVYHSRLIRLGGSARAAMGGSQWYDFAIALQAWVVQAKATSEAVESKIVSCLRRALKEDIHNGSFWETLGSIHFSHQPRLSQHAYIKALEIDIKNVVTWANLGFLYLHNQDWELANEVFIRAQTLDPSHPLSWIGQATLRFLSGSKFEATDLLAHAINLTFVKTEAYLEFANKTFQQLMPSFGLLTHDLTVAFFALHHYCASRAGDPFALHLFGLVSENLGLLELAETLISKSASVLEAEYEDSEDPLIERCFAIANCNLARIRLALRDVNGATDSFQNVISLLSEDHDNSAIELRIQAHIGYGLAELMHKKSHSELRSLEAAIELAQENSSLRSQAIILLAQAMWSVGSEEYKDVAKTQLLQCIATDPTNITAITTLAGMGILSNDEALIEAGLSELLDMPIEQRQQLDHTNAVDYLLIQQYMSKDDHKTALMFAQRALHAVPSNMNARNRLATIALQQGKQKIARAILLCGPIDIGQDTPALAERLSLLATAHALDDSERGIELGLRAVQKAIVMLPSNTRSWQTLAFIRSHAAPRH